MTPNTIDKVLDRLKTEYVGECLHVTNRKPNSNGYYVVRVNYERYYLHRLVYEAHKGMIYFGEVVRHSCDNRLCINPDHLMVGSFADNIEDMHLRNRGIRLGVDKQTCRKGHDLTLPSAIRNVTRQGRNNSRACRQCEKERKK